jgi:hypothetical protein
MTETNRILQTNFSLILGSIPSDTETFDAVSLNLFETAIPTLTIPVIDNFWQGIRVKGDATHNIEYEDWNITFEVDIEFKNWLILYNWLKYITSGKALTTDHMMPKDHTVMGKLSISNNFMKETIVIAFNDVWISSLGPVSLNTRDADSFITCQATLKYSSYNPET